MIEPMPQGPPPACGGRRHPELQQTNTPTSGFRYERVRSGEINRALLLLVVGIDD